MAALLCSFTHVDPFEDTESTGAGCVDDYQALVSPTSIRSRILKEVSRENHHQAQDSRFTHVDPFEDTESPAQNCFGPIHGKSFTHVDPFEDTERA